MRKILVLLLLVMLGMQLANAEEALVVIGHPGLPKADRPSLQRLYTGRAVSLSNQAAMPVSLPAGHPLRQSFLDAVMGQNEEQYTAYWLVRRYVGKGVPPLEVASVDELIKFVTNTPGAVGYVFASKVPPGGNVIFRP